MIVRHRTDRESIDEVISEAAAVEISRISATSIVIAVSEHGATRRFSFQSADHATPVRISLANRAPVLPLTVADCRFHSEQMHPHHYWFEARAPHYPDTVTGNITTDEERGAAIVCAETA